MAIADRVVVVQKLAVKWQQQWRSHQEAFNFAAVWLLML
jgi:hypothetical protein